MTSGKGKVRLLQAEQGGLLPMPVFAPFPLSSKPVLFP